MNDATTKLPMMKAVFGWMQPWGFSIFLMAIMIITLPSCQKNEAIETTADTADMVNIKPTHRSNADFQDVDHIPPDISKILEKGIITFGFIKNDRPPFYMCNEQGDFYGIDVELAKGIANELGVEIVFDRTSETYTELYQKLIHGEIDVVAAKFSRTLTRAVYINYTEPYAEFPRAIMLNKKDEISLNIQGNPIPYLKEKPVKIAAISGTSFVEYAKDMFPLAELVEYNAISEGVNAVINSEVTAFLYDELEFARVVGIQQHIMLYTSVYVIDDIRDYICAAVPMESPNLCKWIDIYIKNNNVAYTLEKMMEEYPDVFSDD